MEIFQPGLNFSHLLREVVTFGGTFVPCAFRSEYLDFLLEEIESLEYGHYESGEEAAVYEKHRDFRARIYQTEVHIPRLRHLVEQLGWQVRLASVPQANNECFYPDDINVWRYSDTSSAIGKHRDYSHDKFLIIGITVTGYCTLEYYGEDKNNPKPKLWQAGPGSLMILRGPGFCENDSRPFHAVNPPVNGERISIVIRQDIRNIEGNSSGKDY
jgi:hypothetical protein